MSSYESYLTLNGVSKDVATESIGGRLVHLESSVV